MNHVRYHAITGDPILYVDHRRKPNGYVDGHCPFCHPSESIKKVYPVDDDVITVWDNLYPVVPEGLVQELVVESRIHEKPLGGHSERGIAAWLQVLRDRMRLLYGHPGVLYVSAFRNWGRQSGGTQPHPHSQLYGLPFIPPAIEREREGFKRLRRESGCCPVCREIEQVTEERVIFRNSWAVSLTPYGSMHPLEVWVIPLDHAARYDNLSDSQLVGMAEVFHRTIVAFERAIGGQAYNIVLHHDHDEDYHLRFVMFARTFTYSGFVLGTGTWINGLDPEKAAALLKEV